MKRVSLVAILLAFLLAFALPGAALAGGLISDRVVFGTNFTLASGETLDGNLVSLGGNVVLETDSEVTGDVVLIGGNLNASGSIYGSVVALGGLVRLEPTAVVDGDVAAIGGGLDRADGARVLGNVTTGDNGPLSLTFPGGMEMPNIDIGFQPFWNLLGFTFKIFLWAALAVLLALFAPQYTRRVSDTALTMPLTSIGLGLLTVVVLVPALVILTITILLAPVSLAVAAVAVLAWMFGLVALGSEVGRRLETALNQNWAPAVSAGLGTALLMLGLNGARTFIPCLLWIFPAAAGMLGLGAVLLTRFGMQPYPPYGHPAVIRPASPVDVQKEIAAQPPDASEPPVPPEPPAPQEPPVPSEPPVPPEPPV